MEKRRLYIQILIGLAAAVLVFKVFQLQVLDSSYQNRAESMVFQKSTLYPSRGLIFDRNNKLFVHNEPIYDIMVSYNRIDPAMDTTRFCELLDIDKSEFKKALNKDWRSPQYSKSVPFIFLGKLSAKELLQFQENLYRFPGFFLRLRNTRSYPVEHAAHLIGYISEVNRGQIQKSKGIYSPGDYTGASGIELQYEKLLRGKKGSEFVVKDNLGRIVGRYQKGERDTVAVSGHDIVSTIDYEIQVYGENLMQGKKGCIVALEPATGEILALVSAPSYDPNELSIERNRAAAYTQLRNDPNRPLFNRSVNAKYPPGSVFKTVLGLIALQEGIVDTKRYLFCSGGYYYNQEYRKCHSHPSPVNLTSAIQHSCNTYFFQIFRELIDKYGFTNPEPGLDGLIEKLELFGLGNPLGVDLPHETAGFLPSSEFYTKIYPLSKGGWKSPTIMSVGIGQGELELSALQMANLAAIIANKGAFFTPHIVKAITNPDLEIPAKYAISRNAGIDTSFFKPIQDGMHRAVEYGTGYNAKVYGIPIMGKTGTSQNPHGKDHSVFFAYAPRKDPKIALAVLVENAGDGNAFAAPITGLMIEKYLNGEIHPYRKHLEDYVKLSNLLVAN